MVDNLVDDIAYYAKGEDSHPQCVWTAIGKGNKNPKAGYPYDAVADAVLTLPLTQGQKVVSLSGKIGTVKIMDDDDTCYIDYGDGCGWWVSPAFGKESADYTKQLDAVADA